MDFIIFCKGTVENGLQVRLKHVTSLDALIVHNKRTPSNFGCAKQGNVIFL